ncbi:hypothetical protein [Sorangium sp. So ce1182]|uniref:hypothetical protein n=1 Tax=Sorangium sp. So ce1182 TaxID=3133334 RepID=UPI003F6189A7
MFRHTGGCAALVAGMAMASSAARAESTLTPLSCQCFGSDLGLCSVVAQEVAPVQEDEMEFHITYKFPCAGNITGLGLATEEAFVPLPFASAERTVEIIGVGPLRTADHDPDRTYTAVLTGVCTVEILGIAVVPTLVTLGHWTETARNQASVITLSLRLYTLAKDYESLSSWDKSKLGLLKDRLETLTQANATDLNYRVMLDTVSAALKNAPPPHAASELKAAAQTLQQVLRADLDAEVAKGIEMAARFTKWHLAIEETLNGVLSTIPNE